MTSSNTTLRLPYGAPMTEAEKRARAIKKRRRELQLADYRPRLKVPAHPPDNICGDCLKRWAESLPVARAAGVLEYRAATCIHPPYSDGEHYAVAFVTKAGGVSSGAAMWLQMSGIRPADWNALYHELMMGRALDLARFSFTQRKVVVR